MKNGFIKYYNSFDNEYGYNLTTGGDSNYNISETTKKKLSEIFSGEGSWNYGRKGILSPSFGKKHSDEIKQKCRERALGSKNPFYGKTHTQETRDKISLANKNKIIKESTRELYKIQRTGEKNNMFGKVVVLDIENNISVAINKPEYDKLKGIRYFHTSTKVYKEWSKNQ